MLSDIRFGLKLLWKEKGFTAAALLTLALCIGANTAIFTVLNAVVLEPLPFAESERLARIGNSYPGIGYPEGARVAGPDYSDKRQMTDTFDAVAILQSQGFDVGSDGGPVRVNGQSVTPSFFRVLRVAASTGRTFDESEAVYGQDKYAVLSYGLWRDLYGKDPGIVGRDVRLTGIPYRVVGVMPEGFESPGSDARIWVPLALGPEQARDDSRHQNNFTMMVRLRPGVSFASAQERLTALDRRNLERYPEYKELLTNARYATQIRSLKDDLVKEVRPTLYLLQAAIGLVLLIGCVNVANLLLVRSNGRMKELAVRFSLGAGRMRLARQLLTESLVLAVAGGALGVAVAHAGVRLLSTLGAREMPRGAAVALDGRALAFCAAVAVLTGLVFGSIPLWRLLRRDLDAVFRGSDRGGTADRRSAWTRSSLVVCQVSLAFVLLTGAGLLTLSFARVLAVDPGFRSEKVMTAAFSLPKLRYEKNRAAQAAIGSLVERVRAIPGVERAGVSTTLPFSGSRSDGAISIEGYRLGPGEPPPVAIFGGVNGEYFQAMGIPLLEGRSFTDADGIDAPGVAMIDQRLARRYWPKGGAVGSTIRRGVDGTSAPLRVVGVVGSVKIGDLAETREQGMVYYPYQQWMASRTARLALKTAGDGRGVAAAVRAELARVDSELALFDVKSMDERVAIASRTRRSAMTICAAFAGLALTLAAIGIYGVLAYGVTQRTREFGIRMALGAGRRDVVGMVAGQGFRLAVAGLAAGVAGAAALMRLMATLLFRTAPTDPGVFAAAGAGVLAVALAAAAVPAVRAVRIHPSSALRHE